MMAKNAVSMQLAELYHQRQMQSACSRLIKGAAHAGCNVYNATRLVAVLAKL